MQWSKIGRDPLLHFMLLGAIIFVLLDVFGSDDSERRIVIKRSDIEVLENEFRKTQQRPPDARDRQALLEQRIEEELLSREAIRLGMLEGDSIIRRHLADKMKFLAAGLNEGDRPDDTDLQRFLRENQEDYQLPASYRFEQVVFEPADAAAREQAIAWLSRLQQNPQALDLPASSQPRRVHATQKSLQQRYGDDFVTALQRLPTGQWQGPLASDKGWHLVLIEQKQAAGSVELEPLRDRLQQAFLLDRYVRQLRQRYQVEVQR